MKTFLFFFLLCSFSILAQDYGFRKGTKGNDYLLVRNKGITFSIGPTWQLTSKNAPNYILSDSSGQRANYTVTPKGKLGFYGEVGYVVFPTWKGLIPIKKLKKTRLLDYMDLGLGYRQYRGIETTELNYTNAFGEITSTDQGKGIYSNGLLYARFSAHTLLYVGKKKIDVARKHFIDQSIGFNLDYTILAKNKSYESGLQNLQPFSFYNPLVAQVHYSIGFGIRFNRAWMMVPGISLPILNLYQWNGVNARMNWFSSTYWPIQGQIRFIKLFERQPKCGAYGDPKDAERDKGFKMGH